MLWWLYFFFSFIRSYIFFYASRGLLRVMLFFKILTSKNGTFCGCADSGRSVPASGSPASWVPSGRTGWLPPADFEGSGLDPIGSFGRRAGKICFIVLQCRFWFLLSGWSSNARRYFWEHRAVLAYLNYY